MRESSKEKTAFEAFEGLYQFRVLPFGLCNGPATLQRLMQNVLRGLGGEKPFCHGYIDDIIVYSDSVEEHICHLQQVFDRLRQVGLKLHPKKCKIAYPRVHYLGHVVSASVVYPDPAKLERFLVPTSVRAVREFLGLAGYYRRFVPNFAKVTAPLHALTRQDVPFLWKEQCQESFERLKPLLASPPPFVLHRDASAHGLGAVLEQEQPDGKLHPVAYARSLRKGKINYIITELEGLALVWSAQHFRPYLLEHHCLAYTDHAPLKAMLKSRNPSGKMASWAETLAELDHEICYRPGRKHSHADALSKALVSGSEKDPEVFQVSQCCCNVNECTCDLNSGEEAQRDSSVSIVDDNEMTQSLARCIATWRMEVYRVMKPKQSVAF